MRKLIKNLLRENLFNEEYDASADMLFGLCVDSKSDDWFGRSSQCETALRANCLWLWLQTTCLQMV